MLKKQFLIFFTVKSPSFIDKFIVHVKVRIFHSLNCLFLDLLEEPNTYFLLYIYNIRNITYSLNRFPNEPPATGIFKSNDMDIQWIYASIIEPAEPAKKVREFLHPPRLQELKIENQLRGHALHITLLAGGKAMGFFGGGWGSIRWSNGDSGTIQEAFGDIPWDNHGIDWEIS